MSGPGFMPRLDPKRCKHVYKYLRGSIIVRLKAFPLLKEVEDVK